MDVRSLCCLSSIHPSLEFLMYLWFTCFNVISETEEGGKSSALLEGQNKKVKRYAGITGHKDRIFE